MLRFDPFAGKALDKLTEADLERLIADQVEEGLFIEYKRDWTAEKVARAVASFANSHGGGTLVVGMDTEGRVPTALVGMETDHDLAENAVQVIRSKVAPTPSFVPATVDLDDGRTCLVVQIPEGSQPPYVLVGKGVILERTPTSSDPVPIHNRDSLDRLFYRGERGRQWAEKYVEGLFPRIDSDPQSAEIMTVPAVENGLGVHPLIFRKSFLDRIEELLDGMSGRDPLSETLVRMAADHVRAANAVIIYDETLNRRLPRTMTSIKVDLNGAVHTSWIRQQVGAGYETLRGMIQQALPVHAEIVENLLGHRGTVAVGAFNRWRTPDDQRRMVRMQRRDIEVARLTDVSFHEELVRELDRILGDLAYEPEEA